MILILLYNTLKKYNSIILASQLCTKIIIIIIIIKNVKIRVTLSWITLQGHLAELAEDNVAENRGWDGSVPRPPYVDFLHQNRKKMASVDNRCYSIAKFNLELIRCSN